MLLGSDVARRQACEDVPMPRRGVHNEFSGGHAETVVQAGAITNLYVGAGVPASVEGRALVPHMSPPLPPGFVPRNEQGGLLVAAVQEGKKHVVLHGPGGFGKSTLVSWLCSLPAVRQRYPDGILWVQVGQNPGSDRLVRLLTGLATLLAGAPSGTFADVLSATQALRSMLAGRRVLLVADDVWSATDMGPFRDLGDGVCVVVTTRRDGMPVGTHIAVGELSPAEATRLLGVPEADRHIVEPLLSRTRHWPLALALTAGLLRNLVERHHKSLPAAVSDLCRELADQGLPSLDGLTDADVANGITRSVELSLEDLGALGDGSEARFVDLAAFPRGEAISYRLLQRLWQVSEVRARAVGDRLLSRSLVSDAGGRGLRLHDVMWETLRLMRPASVHVASVRLLNALRPREGWHALNCDDWDFADSLVFHLTQTNLTEELDLTVRDLRFLARRIAVSGPTAADADLERYCETGCAEAAPRSLVDLLRRESHLLTGGMSAHDVAVTLDYRTQGNRPVRQWLRETGRARTDGGLQALHPPTDHDGMALLRTRAATEPGEFRDLDWHPEGQLLAVAGTSPALEILDVERGWAPVGIINGDCTSVHRVRWSPDGSSVATLGLSDRFSPPHDQGASARNAWHDFHYDLCVYDVRAGREVNAISVPAPTAWKATSMPALCWSPDSRTLAVGRESDVCLWDPSADGGLKPLAGVHGFARAGEASLTWHPQRGLLAHTPARDADGGAVGVLRSWTDPVGEEREPEVWFDRSLWGRGRSVMWRPGGETAALDLDGSVAIVDPTARRVLWRQDCRRVATVHWSPDGRRLAVREAEKWPRRGAGAITLWDIPADAELGRGLLPVTVCSIQRIKNHHSFDEVTWRPDGGALTTTSDRRLLQMWRAHTTETDQTSPHGAAVMTHVRWSPDGRSLAVADENGAWVTKDLGSSAPARVHGRFPFPGRDPARRHTWPEEVNVPAELRPRGGPPVIVDFAAGGERYLTGLWRQPLRVFSAHGRPLTELDRPAGIHTWWDACFTPGGDRIVAAGETGSWEDGIFAVWPLATDEVSPATAWSTRKEARLGGNRAIWRVAASESHAAILANPGYIGLFRLADMQPVCWMRVNGYVYDAAFDPAGHHLAVAGDAALHVFAVRDRMPQRAP
ncbi:NB-ARC domain-containing protein [Streptomyces sp. NPDC021969]|uniref:NB-ARC domain-containing protein n=1 Tax=unclassified Streptomyces TaxID=2593676 RepID=UPI0033CC4A6C